MVNIGNWKDFFCNWPTEINRRGVLIVSFGEQIPFSGFSTGDSFLLLDRQSPDAMGGRTILLPYENILGLKFVDAIRGKTFQPLGFDVHVINK